MAILGAATEITEINNASSENASYVLLRLSPEELRPALHICHLIEHLDPRRDALLYKSLYSLTDQVTSSAVKLLANKARFGGRRREH